MKTKSVVTVALLVFITASVAFLVYREAGSRVNTTAVPQPSVTRPATVDQNNSAVKPMEAPVPTREYQERTPAGKMQQSVEAASMERSQKQPAAVRDTSPAKVVVYYFHGNTRCSTCKRIEALAREAVENNFADELKTGRIVFRAVNVEEPDNEHFVQDYQLATRSVVLARYSGDRQEQWKNLDRVWLLVRDPDTFRSYVVDETSQFFGGA